MESLAVCPMMQPFVSRKPLYLPEPSPSTTLQTSAVKAPMDPYAPKLLSRRKTDPVVLLVKKRICNPLSPSQPP
ncbi:hypothetical protein VTJ04DRAFT_4766 [Mycothermus thermophilus]|uniref:uncharacterized protein n=1 Tax=Humicola insolens TaxID=85995 RepID=UPI0037434A32